MKKRNLFIDVAKGISIILVAFNHTQLAYLLPGVSSKMGLFRMPLFFFLSGVFFNASLKPGKFILKKTDQLLKPYFVTLFLLLFLSILAGENNINQQAIGILYGTGHTIRWTPMWFLPHLWCLFIFSYILYHTLKTDDWSVFFKIILVLLLLSAGSLFIIKFWHYQADIGGKKFRLHGLPFSVDFLLLSAAYFLSGHFLKMRIISFKPQFGILLLSLLMFFPIALLTNTRIDLNSRLYADPVLATCAAICGIYIILSLSYYICKNELLKKVFTAFGSASLFILIFHYYISGKADDFFRLLMHGRYPFLSAAIEFIACITLPLLVRKIILTNEFFKLFYFPLKDNKLILRIRKAGSK